MSKHYSKAVRFESLLEMAWVECMKWKIKAIQHKLYRNKAQIVIGDSFEIIKMVLGKEEKVMDSCRKMVKMLIKTFLL